MTVQRLRDTYGLSSKGEGKLVNKEVSWYRERTGGPNIKWTDISGISCKLGGRININVGQSWGPRGNSHCSYPKPT